VGGIDGHCWSGVGEDAACDNASSWSVLKEVDWSAIDEQLQLAYRLLKKALSSPLRPE
jgi:hypothetical protein